MDRSYASPLDVPTVARHALMSPAHFSRRFKAAYGETPYAYLMSRRVERAMALLRQGSSVTDACLTVGYTSVSSFTDRFVALTGETPSGYRARHRGTIEAMPAMPACLGRMLSRPVGRTSRRSSRIREAG